STASSSAASICLQGRGRFTRNRRKAAGMNMKNVGLRSKDGEFYRERPVRSVSRGGPPDLGRRSPVSRSCQSCTTVCWTGQLGKHGAQQEPERLEINHRTWGYS